MFIISPVSVCLQITGLKIAQLTWSRFPSKTLCEQIYLLIPWSALNCGYVQSDLWQSCGSTWWQEDSSVVLLLMLEGLFIFRIYMEERRAQFEWLAIAFTCCKYMHRLTNLGIIVLKQGWACMLILKNKQTLVTLRKSSTSLSILDGRFIVHTK